jgi:hypothetical protein
VRRNPAATFAEDPTLALVVTEIMGPPAFILVDPYREQYDESGTLDDAIVAYLSLENPHVLDEGEFLVYPVSQSLARKGYGPLVYEAAMAYVGRLHPSGVTPGTQVSPDAERVWKRFAQRRDYHGEELPAELDHLHAEDELNAWYAPRGELPGFDRALANGISFLDGLADRRDEAETFVVEAGDSMFQACMRATPSAVPFSRRVAK